MTARLTDMLPHERPISEEFRVVAKQWADAESAASLLKGTKKDVLEKLKANVIGDGSMPDNKAERLARISEEWGEFKRAMLEAEDKARRLHLQLEYIRMKHKERVSANFHSMTEMGMYK